MISQKGKKGSYGSRGTSANLVCKYVIFDVGSGSYSFELLKGKS